MKKLQDKWIVTRMPYKEYSEQGSRANGQDKNFIFIAHMENDRAVELYVEEDASEDLSGSRIGNIYIGKVSKVVKNIEAAFIEIADRQMCYYSLKDNPHSIFTSEKKGEKLSAGDEILVQFVKEGIKTKEPVVSSALNFPGRFVVLVHGSNHIGVSSKLPAKEKERLHKLLEPFLGEGFGFILRTNAMEAEEEAVLTEAKALMEEYKTLLHVAKHRTVFSCLKKNPPVYCKKLKDIRFFESTEIVTDEEDLFSEMKGFLKEQMMEMEGRLRFYEDSLLPLKKLYSLEKVLSDALNERVWLKSGGYLIIQPTEALTVIDVNTGKFDGKKKKEETFLKINLEAATEIARQLKLRNLSGMILVDFINQELEENEKKLLSAFREELRKDPVKTTLVDITQLGLVELTRKKVQKPLYEQLGRSCPCCHGAGYIF